MFPRSLTHDDNKSFFLFGPRGVGKTGWLRRTFPNELYFDLLEARTYSQLLSDPTRLADRIPKEYSGWVILDEVQRIPELLNEVHRLIESRKLRFIMTGSSARALRRKGVNLLAGRALTRFMHPLTIEELGESFSLKHSLRFGSLPSVYTENDPAAYLASYVATYLREEVQQEGLTRNLAAFSRFLEVASFSQSEVLTMAEVARESSISVKVIQDYFTILEDLLLAVRLPVFSKRAKRRLIAHPKFLFFDSGVFNSIRPKGPLDHPELTPGASVETLFYQQVRALNDYHKLEYSIFYWRTQAKEEVDFVLYGPRGIHAFELKHADRVRGEDLTSLRIFLQDYPGAKGHLLYLGREEYNEAGVSVMPLEVALRKFVQIAG
jgi:predicted AAA+ superfamily ATPase